MHWLWAVIVGLVLGLLAKLILPGKQEIPIWLTALLGIAGGLLGNAVAHWIGVDHTKGIDWVRHGLQLGGAVLLVAVGTPLWARFRSSRRAT
ncbi:GlsB/YeaQ/YmgE family stress response membrane protein [Streptomyces sp. NPDC050658]|uniref:GlsB/YeaQ/YmgE family stress response membrane protein n=1 Tax=unclassified Streptomyces TaxID=2593676 RepID=UPI0034394C48